VLIGGSLLYANTKEALTREAKEFVHLTNEWEVLSWADRVTQHNNVFALRLKATDGDDNDDTELLLLAADTPREKFEWQECLNKAIGQPRCPPERVAALMALQTMGSPSAQRPMANRNKTADDVAESSASDRRRRDGHPSASKQSSYPRAKRDIPAPSSRAAQTHAPLHAQPSAFESWFDKYVPEIFRNT